MCNCHDTLRDSLVPTVAVITDVRHDTHDVATFRVTNVGGGLPFSWMPGQCAMISLPGIGEALFSITSSPTNTEYMEFSVKRCGVVTDALHLMSPG